jgi:TonB-dependent SusC/RagA subfamily outer membrane receptor
MTIIAQYFLKLSISLAFVYLFYALVLRRLTFYSWNRWYLIGYSLLAFFIPFVNIEGMLQKNEWTGNKVIELIPSLDNYTKAIKPVQIPGAAISQVNYWSIIILFFLAGFAILGIRLLIQYVSYRRLRYSATLLSSGEVKVYQVNKPIIPFSFGNAVFINQHQHTDAELEKIIRHEFIHVKQKHTVDIMWGELLCMLNWYNPFAWLIRRSIRQNLEFIADNRVICEGADKKQYQYLLLKVVGVPGFSLSQQFNFSSLKKRIAMMNKVKSAKLHLLRFLFILPLVAVLLVSFRDKIDKLLTIKSKPVLLQQPTDTNIEAVIQSQLHIKAALSHVAQLAFLADTTPKAKESSRPPADSGSYIIDATQHKTSVNLSTATTPVIRFGRENSDEPLIVIDGVVQEGGMASIKDLNPNLIQEINVLKDEHAVATYGDKGKNGVIIIITKDFAKKYGRGTDTTITSSEDLLKNLNGFKGIIMLDDIDFSVEEFKNMNLPVDSIDAVSVYRGEVAEPRWGKKAANGVIKIETKAYRKMHSVVNKGWQRNRAISSEELAKIEHYAQENNWLYVDVRNKLLIDNLDNGNLLFESGGELSVIYDQGSYYTTPKKPGKITLKIFHKLPDNTLQLLQTRQYEVRYMPDPESL